MPLLLIYGSYILISLHCSNFAEFNGKLPFDLIETFASPACLPSRGYLDNENAVVSGWGTTSEGWMFI
jgi:hypothetical protein